MVILYEKIKVGTVARAKYSIEEIEREAISWFILESGLFTNEYSLHHVCSTETKE